MPGLEAQQYNNRPDNHLLLWKWSELTLRDDQRCLAVLLFVVVLCRHLDVVVVGNPKKLDCCVTPFLLHSSQDQHHGHCLLIHHHHADDGSALSLILVTPKNNTVLLPYLLKSMWGVMTKVHWINRLWKFNTLLGASSLQTFKWQWQRHGSQKFANVHNLSVGGYELWMFETS